MQTIERMVVTAKLEAQALKRLTLYRDKYFPQERNFLQAHVTLFHAAPRELSRIWKLPPAPITLSFTEAFFMGKGFGIRVECPELVSWRKNLLTSGLVFTPQDQASRKLHVTIQNKTDPKEARQDFDVFKQEWQPFEANVIGLETWEYLGGPWRPLGCYELR